MNNPTPSTPPVMDPNQSPDSRHEKINTMWKIAAMLYTFAALGLCIYWMFNESGLCETICGWQAEILDGSCYIALNLLGALLILLVPLFIAKVVVEKVTGVKLQNPNYNQRHGQNQ